MSTNDETTDHPVRIDTDLADKAKVIIQVRGVKMSEYLSPILRPIIERDFEPAIEELRQATKRPRRRRSSESADRSNGDGTG